ncbi:transcriptional regulator [Pseudorhodoferax aquiterrae]|uniref:Transcriptional regulator n=1 Tax=Pseudorhodoferax aquiterrae TaxID=747304 RepID=A0ABQ3G4P6_9BURK|nr:GntR family transcriptional regulator [Pseudorhodoferax aquiterrae]GHC89903.1 transcriptional regulator [Pseudorhodoferax aquiterrae]
MHPQEQAIHATLAQTLLAGRLAPGTQLIETRLAQIFGVSRERVRKVLHRLGHERLLELIPNRGCFVSSPTLAQAREIYEARRIVEGGLVGRLAGRLTAAQLAALQAHGAQEHAALHAQDRARSIQLSGEFHLLLASFADSPFVLRALQELVSRTAMLVAFFEPAASSACACEEHDDIVRALAQGDAARAMKAMHAHLSLIETRLQPRAQAACGSDADAEIARAWEAAQQQVAA